MVHLSPSCCGVAEIGNWWKKDTEQLAMELGLIKDLKFAVAYLTAEQVKNATISNLLTTFKFERLATFAGMHGEYDVYLYGRKI